MWTRVQAAQSNKKPISLERRLYFHGGNRADGHTDNMMEISQPVVQSTDTCAAWTYCNKLSPLCSTTGRERGEAMACGLKRIGRGIEDKRERGEDRRKAECASCLETALTHMLLISRGGRGGGTVEERVVKLLRGLSVSVLLSL